MVFESGFPFTYAALFMEFCLAANPEVCGVCAQKNVSIAIPILEAERSKHERLEGRVMALYIDLASDSN